MGTGPWHDVEELYTDIRVIVETDDLDMIINFDSGDEAINNALQPFKDIAEQQKSIYEFAGKYGAEALAEHNRSIQELTIGANGNVASGTMVQSIRTKEIGDKEYLIGVDVPHFYPLCIEFGRGPVYPIRVKYLHYYTLSGVEVFSKYSSPSQAYPFVQPAFENTIDNAEEIIRQYFGD